MVPCNPAGPAGPCGPAGPWAPADPTEPAHEVAKSAVPRRTVGILSIFWRFVIILPPKLTIVSWYLYIIFYLRNSQLINTYFINNIVNLRIIMNRK